VYHSPMVRKPLVTHGFSAVVLMVIVTSQFLVFRASAGLHGTYTQAGRIMLQETAVPTAGGDYYRRPGKFVEAEGSNRWFGPEVNSPVLCPGVTHVYNPAGFFDITYVREDAEVWPSVKAGKVWWYRRQEWRFASADTPWGTDSVYITLIIEIDWANIDVENSVTGYPWSGFEEHWRDGDAIKSKAEVVGYYKYEHAGKKYLAPKYYKVGTLTYFCVTERGIPKLKVLQHTEGDFTRLKFRPETNMLSCQEKGAENITDAWYDCVPLK